MARDRQPGEWPPVTSQVRPADYADDDVGTGDRDAGTFVPGTDAQRRGCRGAVEFHPRWRNYSFHKVDIDTGNQDRTIEDCNFSLATLRISGTGVVTFRGCNLARARWHMNDGATVVFVESNTFRGQEV